MRLMAHTKISCYSTSGFDAATKKGVNPQNSSQWRMAKKPRTTEPPASNRRGPKIRMEPKSEAVRVVLAYIRCALAAGRPMRGLQTEAAEVAGVSQSRANRIWKRWGECGMSTDLGALLDRTVW